MIVIASKVRSNPVLRALKLLDCHVATLLAMTGVEL
jgi:hypothetical protein